MTTLAEILVKKLVQLKELDTESKIISAQKKAVKETIDEILQRADKEGINAQIEESEFSELGIQPELFH